ncbi:MAG: MFS transporter [Alphaproteobacteria bacterium]|nr:MFS transporter [Alphaproteobacteria bacterium]
MRPRFAVLRHRDYALNTGAQFVRTISLQIQSTALAWQIYEITRDPFQLALVGLAVFLPAVFLSIPAGHLADHYDRRRLVLIGISVELAAGAVLFGMAMADRMTENVILALALSFGTARAVTSPAARSIMPSLVPRQDLANAVAWSSTSWQVAAIAGPGIGGLLYAVSPHFAYGALMIGLAIAMMLIFIMRSRPIVVDETKARDPAAILAGIVLICRNPLLLGTISLDLFAVLFSGATALIPVFAQDILQVGADAGGLLRSAQGLGASVTALLLTQFPLQRHVGTRLFVSVGVFGIAAIVFGLSRDYWLSFGALLLLGAGDMVSVYIRTTLVPLATPDELRGRVLAVESVFIVASNELGTFVSGTAGALVGPVAAVLLGGSLTLGVTFLWPALFPQIRKIDRFSEIR